MQRRLKNSALAGVLLSGVFAVFVIASLLASQFAALHGMSRLHFDAYSLVSYASAIGSFIIIFRIIAGNSRSEETGWFLLVLFAQTIFAGGEALQRSSLDPAAAVFWARISGAGASMLGVGLLLFTLSYIRPARIRATLTAPILLWANVFVITFYAGTSLVFNANPALMKLYPWGFNNDAGSAFWIVGIWIMLPAFTAVAMLLHFRRHNDNPLLRKQSLLYALAILLPTLAAGITDVLLPSFNVNVIPPLSTATELITCIVLFYGTQRYQFFQINPAVLAENVLSTMSEAVVVTKADFSIEYINNEAENLLGLADDNLHDIYIHTLFSPESWGKINEFMQGKRRVSPNSDDFGDITVIDRSGKRTPVRALISGLQEGSYQAYIFVITNISDMVASYRQLESDANRIRSLLDESHRLQEQLRIEKENVEQIVEVRTRELRRAQDELKESDKLKTEFIMIGSHNLRTPITIMSSSLELLKTTNDEQQRDHIIKSFDQGITRLREFVEEMVEISTLESGSGLQHEPVTIADLLDPLVADAQAIAAARPKLTINTDIQDTDTTIMANASRLRGALNNLVTNAFKFTENGQITIAAHLQDNQYVITVQDTGIGIAAEEMPRLFTKFHRGTDTLQYEYEGKGIGLYLSKLIITEHGGTLTAESTPNVGSTFTATLPLHTADEQQAVPSDPPASAEQPPAVEQSAA